MSCQIVISDKNLNIAIRNSVNNNIIYSGKYTLFDNN